MKKTILMAIFLAGICFSANAKVVITKHGWGLFKTWYDYVEQVEFKNGDIFVSCWKPGFTKCAVSHLPGVVFPGNPTALTQTTFETLIDYAENSITSTHLSGTFIFDNTYYVTYSYTASTDNFTVTIYSLQEATDLHLIN
jgi:hypothetical protein